MNNLQKHLSNAEEYLSLVVDYAKYREKDISVYPSMAFMLYIVITELMLVVYSEYGELPGCEYWQTGDIARGLPFGQDWISGESVTKILAEATNLEKYSKYQYRGCEQYIDVEVLKDVFVLAATVYNEVTARLR